MKAILLNKRLPIFGPESRSGFTIIELLTVVSVVLFLSAMVFANYHAGNSRLSLELEANKMVNDIRSVQEMGLSGPKVPDMLDKDVGGYGIYFSESDNSLYKFFVDNSGGDHKYESGKKVLQTISLDANYYVKSLKGLDLVGNESEDNSISLLFVPPEPVTFITGDDADLVKATITIASRTDPSLAKSIIVNKAGLIYAQ